MGNRVETKQQARGKETDLVSFRKLNTNQIRKLVHQGMQELLQRAIADEDPDILIAQAMQFMFDNSGSPLPPKMLSNNILSLSGTVRDTSAGKHICTLYTIQLPDDGPPAWSWEPTGTLIHNDHEKVGQIRRSVSIHSTIDDMVVARHDMTWNGERHVRNASRAWRLSTIDVSETGESKSVLIPEANYTPTHLPPPHGEIDTRSARGQI